MNNKSVFIFTDGASRGNPGPGGWGAVIVYNDSLNNAELTRTSAEKEGMRVIELGGREEHTTNNRMELTAVIKSLELLAVSLELSENPKIIVYSDASYVVNGITKWVHGWKKNGWITKEKKPVENKELWEKLDEVASGKKIEWKNVGGHAGVVGNERCDVIATSFADNLPVELYDGPFQNYPIKDILNLNGNGVVSGSKRAKAKAYSYVSMVDGIIETHKTWKECEDRVRGKTARFKKALDAEEEKKVIQEFKGEK